MSQARDPEGENKPETPAGRVKHDSGGRAIWEWAVESGRQALESTSLLLKRLEMPGLELEEDAKKKTAADEEEPAPTPSARKGSTYGGPTEKDSLIAGRRSFNPYDNKTPMRPTPKPVAPKVAPRITQPPLPVKKPGLLRSLFGRKG